MSNISGPTPNKPKDPYEGYKVEAIEKETLDPKKNKPPPSKKKGKKIIFQNAFFLFFSKIFRSLFPQKTRPAPPSEEILEIWEKLYLLFENMKQEKAQEEPAFLQHFAYLWEKLLENLFYYKKFPEIHEKILLFIEEVESFPEGNEFSFGYYLSNASIDNWLPFPFIALLKNLYEEHIKDPEKSKLQNWSLQIRDFLFFFSSLKEK